MSLVMPYVPSTIIGGIRRGPVLARVWHMAEGGGTVEHLSGDDPRGVSVHVVIRYSGQLVRMLPWDRMHTSIRTSAIRTDDDADGFYGATAAREVMGDWANTKRTLGPNHASLAVEVEGRAADGPNRAQVEAIVTLNAEFDRMYPGSRNLGHRDFASYKACPGKKFPWDRIGHGIIVPEVDMPGLNLAPVPPLSSVLVDVDKGVTAIVVATRERFALLADANARPAVGPFDIEDLAGIQRGYLVDFAQGLSWVNEATLTIRPTAPTSYPVVVGGKNVGSVTLP